MKTITKIITASVLLGSLLFFSGCTGQLADKSTDSVKELTSKVTGQKEETDPDAGLITFSQPDHKFSLKHPKGWLYVPEIDKATLFTGSLEQEDPSQEDFMDEIQGTPFTVVYNINMRVEDNKENLSAREKELSRYIPKSRADIDKTLVDVEIAGVKGIKIKNDVTQVNTSGPVTAYVFAPGNGKIYSFLYTASAHKDTHEQYLAEFEEILSTLEFTD